MRIAIASISVAVYCLFSLSARAEEKTLEQLKADLTKIDQSIELTRQKMKEVKDVAFLPDLYFVLAELYVEKSRYEYTITRQENPKMAINEIDFNFAKKSKKQAIEVYQRIVEMFAKTKSVDKALFFMAHEYREVGQIEDMVKTYTKIVNEFPQSPYWEESELILGDFFLEEKKEPKMALEYYRRILARPQNPFIPIARYKTGWCYMNMENFYEALLAFEGVLTIDANVPLEGLPDIYKKSDIRRDSLSALVWPYSEQKKLDAFRANALSYFQGLAPNRPTLIKVLDKLAKRLMLKNKIDQVVPVYFRLIELTNDLERRIETTEKFYEAWKKTTRNYPIEAWPVEITNTLIRARAATFIDAAEKKKNEVNFEIYLRDITTQLQKRAKARNTIRDYRNAIQGYKSYLFLFPNTKHSSDILLNLAESYFLLKNYALAGVYYERLARRPNQGKKNILDSAIQSFALALKNPDKLSKLELTESREGFRSIGTRFVKQYPTDRADAMILFNIARTYYDERDFDKAVKALNQFLNAFPNHKEATTAGNLILDSYNQREDYEGLIKAGKALIANKRFQNTQFKNDVAEIVKQAEYRKIQNAVGDPKSRDYAKKLLGFASKYQGSSIGDQALYEAFTSLKAKKSPEAYEPGEQLLLKHGDSRYAKEVVGAMGQMAVNSADYRRAAKYFEAFAKKYPKDPSSRALLKNAATMRELMGDFPEAAEDFRTLGERESVARQFALSQDWVNLGQTLAANPIRSLRGTYWTGLSLYRQNRFDQAKPFLAQAAKASASSYEDKKMAAHAIYLLATQSLKDYQAIQLGGGQNEAQLVKIKNAKLSQLTNQFQRVIGYGSGRWTIAALYQLGRAHNEFAQFINGAAVPQGLTAAQQAQYKSLIAQQSGNFKQKAKAYFSACLQNAEKFEVFTGFVRGCQDPEGQMIDESVEERLALKASESAPREAAGIRLRLFDNPKNTQLLMELAQAYLKAQDYSLARVILNRVLELKPNYATAEAQMGVVFLFINDLESAQNIFKRALKHNSRDATALWGLAGLYKNFGFTAKYQALASRAQAAGRPAGITHPLMN